MLRARRAVIDEADIRACSTRTLVTATRGCADDNKAREAKKEGRGSVFTFDISFLGLAWANKVRKRKDFSIID